MGEVCIPDASGCSAVYHGSGEGRAGGDAGEQVREGLLLVTVVRGDVFGKDLDADASPAVEIADRDYPT